MFSAAPIEIVEFQDKSPSKYSLHVSPSASTSMTTFQFSISVRQLYIQDFRLRYIITRKKSNNADSKSTLHISLLIITFFNILCHQTFHSLFRNFTKYPREILLFENNVISHFHYTVSPVLHISTLFFLLIFIFQFTRRTFIPLCPKIADSTCCFWLYFRLQ